MIIKREAKDTLTPVEMIHGDTLEFGLLDGAAVEIELVDTGAEIMGTTLKKPGVEEPAGTTTLSVLGRIRRQWFHGAVGT